MRHIAVNVVFAIVLAACRAAPDASPDELEKEAFSVVGPDGKTLAYVVLPPITSKAPEPSPAPKFYGLDGYRIFPYGGENNLMCDRIKLSWALRCRVAERLKRKTIAIDEDEADDFLVGRP